MVKLQRVSVLSLGKIFCGIHAVVGFIMAIILTIGSISGQEDGIWALGAWSLLIFPLVNAALGFVTGLFLGFCYNQIAKFFGGIEIEIQKEDLPHLTEIHS